ncbi:hypothetical protein B0J14DRAFT_690385 [Halenospora varia]|nr:hypothetical protein B0J14DRAFT_690385 [Halenospora varia]
MLRSRFKQSGGSGKWSQFISTDIASSYILHEHDVPYMGAVEHIIHQTQKSFDLQKGPLFGADLINLPDESQLLFLASHHVIIDLVSWRIVMEDLEAILTLGILAAPKPIPFSTWIKRQIQYSQEHITPARALPFEVRPADFAYWGMEDRPNLSGDIIKQVLSVPKSITALILGACNEPLKTDVVDLLLSAVIHSFGQSFTDRCLPTIFNEGHGREPWDASLDISRTYHPSRQGNKGCSPQNPKNGFEYFTSRYLTYDGAEAFGHHDQMEIVFNYFGLYQQFEREDSLFNQIPAKTFDLGNYSASMPESSLFEIEVGVEEGELQFTFAYNQFMRHQDKISNWVNECGKSVETLAHSFSEMQPEFTLSDFPLLSLSYSDLDILLKQTLPQLKVDNSGQIEDIYPCSPMQEGILVAQNKRAEFYKVEETFKISSKVSGTVDITRLKRAWKQVVARHAILRTMCVESVSENSGFQQVVLETHEPRVFHVQAKDHASALQTFKNYIPINYSDPEPGHRLGICQLENGDVYFRLEINHTLNDAMSYQIICKEIGLAYDGLLPNTPGPSYSEYINYIQCQPAGLALDYWKNYLAGIKPCRFPILNDGDIQSPGEINILNTLTIPFHKAGLMNSFCKAQGLTQANVITTVWGLLLQTYTGESDICFGFLTSGRDLPLPDVQDIVGPLINMVISRVSLPDSELLTNVLEKAQADYISASPYQVCSLAEVYHALDLAGDKLFNTAISVDKKWSNDLSANSSIAIEEFDLHDPTDFDLVLNVAYSGDEFKAAITYNTASISDKHAAKITDTFERILTSVLESPDQKVANVDRLGIQNVKQLLAWNEGLPSPLEKCVHDAVHEQALLHPGLPAVSSWDGELSYAELDEMSTRFSHYLSKLGVALEIVVPLAFEKSRWVIVSQLGVLKAGGACLTMDMSHPTNRLKGMCKQVNAKLLLAAPGYKDKFQDTGIHTVVVDEAFIRSLPFQSEFACTTVKPNNMGFVVFTSGSTGNPKGIMLEHKTVCTSSRGHQAVFDVGPGSRCLQFSAFAFDVHISDIFTPLMYGGCCCVPSDKQRMGDLAGAIRAANANSTYITPTVAKLFQPEDVPSLKKVALGGEPLTQENAKTWGGSLYLINVFGPSETSNWVSYRHVLQDTTQPSNIGPGVDVNIWLVDHLTNTRLVPVGCVGEMFIEGPILARGYINDPTKTEAAFIEDPIFLRKYGGGAGRRFYGTGDLVRANTNGSLLYVGRKDSQVKVHGQRLELGEVEYAISESPEVKHVSVVLPKSGLYNGHLVAVVVLHGITEDHGGEPLQIISAAQKSEVQSKLSALIDRVAAGLAAWMVPHFWAIVNDIPSSASSKLDRGRVKQFITDIDQETLDKISALTIEGQLEMPTTTLEKQLRDAWSKILGVPLDQIGTNSSFLRLGGDSLSIMRLVAEARSHGIILSTVSVFRHPKLKDMALVATGGELEVVSEIAPFSLLSGAAVVESIRAEAASKCYVSAELIEDIYPCSPLQEGLMALSIVQPGTYIAQNVYKLPPGLDLAVFRQAWQLVYQANAILRTRVISTESSGTVQVIVSDEISWSTDNQLEAYLKKDKETKMLHGLPLSRFAVIEGHLIMTTHHAIYDGWSLNALLEDAVAAYQQQSLEIHTPYKYFIKHIQELDQKAAESFWISELSNANTTIFPSIPYPKYQPKADTLLVQDIQFSRKPRSEITTPTILEAAWALVTSQYVGDTNITFGLLLSGRNASIPGVAGMTGPTIATVPVQVRVDHDLSLENFLQKIQNQTTEMMPFEQTGLQNIRRLNAATEAACDFQTQLVIQSPGKTQTGLQSLGIDQINNDSDDILTYTLTFECILTSTGLKLNTLFDSEVIPYMQMKRIIQQFAHMIHVLSDESSTTTVNDVLTINVQDEREILTWNPTIPEFVEKLVHEEIHEQALTRPDAPAICAWDGDLTYKELDTLSSRLGYCLRAVGVKPEISVPFCFEKSKWCIVAILAIMKAGGICVPLEPDHPITRKQGMVQDVNSKILLSSAMQVDHCSGIAEQIVVVDDVLLSRLPDAPSVICPELHPRHPVYVIFTSGSTGKPKAVVWEHRTLSSSIAKHGSALHFNRRPRVLQFASNVFDASVAEVIDTLTYGGCLCIPSDSDKTTNFVQYINEMRVDWVFLTPTFARLIGPDDVPGLKTLALGGESIGQDNIRNWSEKVQLINAYGPSECCILTTTHEFTNPSQSPSTIGRSTGGLVWIVDVHDTNKLVPIGAVGEILVEGPTLGLGYLHNTEKTAESFISDPKWSQRTRPAGCRQDQSRRFYRTGDLGRYHIDGTISFIGRKDNQVKIRGQRVELGEVEHTLMQNSLVQHAITIVPASGPCRGQLVAALTLSGRTITGKPTPLQILSDEVLPTALLKIREELAEKLPVSMIPSVWLPVEDLPQTTTGKLDRVAVKQWVNNINQEILDTLNRLLIEKTIIAPTTPTEMIIQAVWSHVLNIPLVQIGSNSAFMKLGGDSITAIQVASRSRTKNIELTVPDILRYKTLSELALHAKPLNSEAVIADEELDVPFELSPIQQMHMEQLDKLGTGGTDSISEYFNQSFLLQVNRHVTSEKMHLALEVVVDHHSMLRARFERSDAGKWSQTVQSNTKSSFQFGVHNLSSTSQIESVIAQSQASLNIQRGPVFGADLIDVKDSKLLFITAHHLVIDLVSWRIILQDLEELLDTGSLSAPKPISFQSWIKLQRDYATQIKPSMALPFDVPTAQPDYWGMADRANLVGDLVEVSFDISKESSVSLLGSANEPLSTAPLDLFLSAIFHAFAQTFNDRKIPAIYNESHGREPWDSSIDLSRTVGWFTTLAPIAIDATSDLVQVIRQVKDTRRRILQNGWSYFTSRFLTTEGRHTFAHHNPMEIIFNYSGHYQQLERAGAMLSQSKLSVNLHEQSRNLNQAGLFNIGVGMNDGSLRFSFTYNRYLKHQARISTFISRSQTAIEKISLHLPNLKAELTLSHFPLLPLNYSHLNTLIKDVLPKVGVQDQNEVEDFYPCAPIQEGILIAQSSEPGLYKVENIFKISSLNAGEPVDEGRLQRAWEKVVRRHAVLRTVFVPSILDNNRTFQQLVLKTSKPRVFYVESDDNEDGIQKLKEYPSIDYAELRPGHRLGIYKSPDKASLYCRLEISHALTDAITTRLICKEIALAYDGQLVEAPGPLYSNYIAYIESRPAGEALDYWKSYLKEIKSCHLPRIHTGDNVARGFHSIDFSVPNYGLLQSFCMTHDVTVSNVMQAVWALVLQSYTGEESVCFGYLASGRDLLIPGVADCLGPMINVLICSVDLNASMSILDVLKKIQDDYINSLPHQVSSLAEIQHGIGCGSERLFNTGVSIQKSSSAELAQGSSISFEQVSGYDPSDFELVLNATYSDDAFDATMTYATHFISDAHARNIEDTFQAILGSILDSVSQRVIDTKRLGNHNQQQISKWNSVIPEAVDDLVHHKFQKEVQAHPESQAVLAWDGELSYSELDILSTRLALHLCNIGLKPEQPVPFCFEKSMWTIVSVLAIVKAGGVCVPLEPDHPFDRKKGMIEDTGATILLTSEQQSKKCLGLTNQLVVVSPSIIHSLPIISKGVLSNDICDNISATSAVYILFTSGSTGKPKGVVWEHRNFGSSMGYHERGLDLRRAPRVLQFASHVFDCSALEILTTLCLGGCVCVPSDEDKLTNFVSYVNSMNVNWAFLTPTFARLINPQDIPNLRTLVLGGEPIGQDNIDKWSPSLVLLNGFGPSETTVCCASKVVVPGSSNPNNFGTPTGSAIWITDSADVNKLLPIGAIGEILIEGPILARGYLNNDAKTAESFIYNPEWSLRNESKQRRRFYRTGDLGKYEPDGTLVFIGRRDNQIKVRGQRMDLGEVEHNLRNNDLIEHAVVLAPKAGPCRGKLVVVFTLAKLATENLPTDSSLHLISDTHKVELAKVAHIRDYLSEKLPTYMVPNVWCPVYNIPMTVARKLDRISVMRWMTEISQTSLNQINELFNEQTEIMGVMSPMEGRLQAIWADVLNLPKHQVTVDKPFLKLGGDSITAIQIQSRCRTENINITVQDILRQKTISKLGSLARTTEGPMSNVETLQEETDTSFELSPIQQLYIGRVAKPGRYFNQSFLLQPKRAISPEQLRTALDAIVDHHSMLRARFARSHDASHKWTQLATKDISESYIFRVDDSISSLDYIESVISYSQASLNIESGPLFGANLFNLDSDNDIVTGNQQLLFLTAHHLVVDLVSWRIILQDLEELLSSGRLSAPKSLPFQTWVNLQSQYANDRIRPEQALPFEVPAADYSYWGMAKSLNLAKDTVEQSFILTRDQTSSIFGSANEALNTEPLDLLLSAVIYAFAQTFSRQVPSIFNEGHGREPWDTGIDLSRTVGWFTTFFPLSIDVADWDNIVEIVRQVKDTRFRVPNNGWSYMASRFLTPAGKKRFAHHNPEIVFNYTGSYQQLEREDALLGQTSLDVNLSEQAAVVEQIGLFNIGASQISQWISRTKDALGMMADRFGNMEKEFTLSDFPHVHMGYRELHKLLDLARSSEGVAGAEIQTILPATGFQADTLAATMSKGRRDLNYLIFEIKGPLHITRIQDACRSLIKRHAILRTIFVANQRQLFQVVLKSGTFEFTRHQGEPHTENQPSTFIVEDMKSPMELGACLLRFMLIEHGQDHNSLILKLPHAQFDSISMSVLIHDLRDFYSGKHLAPPQSPSEYLEYVDQNRFAAVKYWTDYLNGASITQFLKRPRPRQDDCGFKNIKRIISPVSLRSQGIDLGSVLKGAWAVLLAQLSGTSDVVFGDLVNGRNAPVDGIENMSEVYINKIPFRVRFGKFKTVLEFLRHMADQQIANMPYEFLGTHEIIDRCTDWPTWTTFGSSVNYRSLPFTHKPLAAEAGTKWTPSQFTPYENANGLNIESNPMGDDLCVSITYGDKVLPPSYVEELLDRLCSLTMSFSKNPEALLPLIPKDTLTGPRIPTAHMVGHIPKKPSGNMITSDAAIDIVQRVWERTLNIQKGTVLGPNFTIDTPFYVLWGHTIAAVQFAHEYSREGIKMSVEDALAAPSMRQQIMICAQMLRLREARRSNSMLKRRSVQSQHSVQIQA